MDTQGAVARTTMSPGSRLLRLVLAAVLALGILASSIGISQQAFAAENAEVNSVRDGVYAITVYYHHADTGVDEPIQYGSCFFINRYELVTNYHVIEVDHGWDASLATYFNDAEWRNSLLIKVTLMRDIEITVSLINGSEATDFAVLKVDDEAHLGEHATLVLADSDAVKQTESVYAIGYPAINRSDIGVMEDSQGIASFTAADTTVEDGAITRVTTASDGTKFIQHSAQISDGNSGGPLVNDKGQTIGVNSAVAYEFFGPARANYAIASNQVKSALQKLNIAFTSSEDTSAAIILPDDKVVIEPEPEPDPADKVALQTVIAEAGALTNLDSYTDETVTPFNQALAAAKTTNDNETATQEQVDTAASTLRNAMGALEQKPLLSTPLLIGIIVAAVVIIAAVVVIIIVTSRRRKRKAAPTGPLGTSAAVPSPLPPPSAPAAAPAPAQTSYASPSQSAPPPRQQASYQPQSSYSPAPAPVFDASGSGDTTVLNPSVGETSLLGGAQSAASLLRKSNNENIRVNKQEFVIGKERSKVNYYIPDNSTISRKHAKITMQDGQYYITDLNTTNYTYINGKKIPTNTETPIHTGDIIKLSDEEFEFKA